MLEIRTRSRVLVAIAAIAGAFCATAMMSAVTAPSARADDFTNVIANFDADYLTGQGYFTTALSDFSSDQLIPGLEQLLQGVNEDVFVAPQQLVDNTVQLLTGGPLDPPTEFGLGVLPTDFADALQLAESGFASIPLDLTSFVDALSIGNYGLAIDYITNIPEDVFFYPVSELILGAAVSF
jgi:hypothetical protein